MDILGRLIAGKKGQKERFWSDDEKRSICAQTTVPGVSVAQVAWRYAMYANLTHNWLKDTRFAPEPEIAEPDCYGRFLSVEIEGAVAVPLVEDARGVDAVVSARRIDNTLSDGRRILVEGPTSLTSVLSLVERLMV